MVDEALALHAFDAGPGDLEERKQLLTTHRRTWMGSQLLLRYLLDSAQSLGFDRPGVSVLELGSGGGWMGLNLAARIPVLSITLSELPAAVLQLQANLERVAASVGNGLAKRVQIVELDWQTAESSATAATTWDWIIGTELLYSHSVLTALTHAIDALAGAQTRVLYCHVPGRKPSVDDEMHAEFAARGLTLRPVTWESAGGAEQQADEAHQAPSGLVEVGSADSADETPWLPDGGLFAQEDDDWRASRPVPELFEVVRTLC